MSLEGSDVDGWGMLGVSTAISRWLLNEKLGGESNGVDCQCIFEQQLLKKRTLRVLHFILSTVDSGFSATRMLSSM